MDDIIDEQNALIIVQEELIKQLKLDIKILKIKNIYLLETNIKRKRSLKENIANYY